jgi:hypothetical protein
MRYQEVSLDAPTNMSYFYCWQFNFDANRVPEQSPSTGFTGSVSMLFEVPPVPEDNAYRQGVQVSFSIPGDTVPYAAETKYAAAGLDSFFTMTKVENTKIDQPTVHSWDASVASLDLPFNDTAKANLVGVSFGYNTFSVTTINQVPGAQPTDLAGNISGMAGTLTGLDAQKTILMIFSIPYSIFSKSLDPFFDLMG